MNILELVQSLHYEAKQPGTEPQTVIGQSGRTGDFVRWIVEAYKDIQREKDGKWKWLFREFHVETVADQNFYAPSDCKDTLEDAAITRFRGWYLDDDNPPFLYPVAVGPQETYELLVYDQWRDFRRRYLRRPDPPAQPSVVSRDSSNMLYLGPTPDDIYRVSGQYWRSTQTLDTTDNVDVPEMPEDFHMLIVYRAMVKYGYNIIAQELVARATAEGTALYDSLVANQWAGRDDRMRWPDALA